MLYRSRGHGFDPWSSGAALFQRREEGEPELPLIGVRCRLGQRYKVWAMLDTGAEWSVISEHTASIVHDQIVDLDLEPIRYWTRRGLHEGRLQRVSIELLADPSRGNDLVCDATVLVIRGWEGPDTLGFRGCLERIRFALDPDDEDPLFYFGTFG